MLEENKTGDVVIQRVEFAGPKKDGKPIRVFGILAFPAGGTKLLAVFWSQNGIPRLIPGASAPGIQILHGPAIQLW